jgi:Kef-type K+ transport system membrane component KefB
MACAVTALPILVVLMEKLQILRQPLGQRILRYASLDDITIWGVLALILLDWQRVGRQAGFLLLFGVVAVFMRKLMRAIPERDRWYVGLIWLATCGFVADWAGLHFMVGAFLSGAVLDSDMFNQKQMDQVRHHILLAVMPVFFLLTGLRTDWSVGGYAVFGAAALLLVAAVSGKLAGVHIAGKALKWEKGEASVIGWLLQTKRYRDHLRQHSARLNIISRKVSYDAADGRRHDADGPIVSPKPIASATSFKVSKRRSGGRHASYRQASRRRGYAARRRLSAP